MGKRLKALRLASGLSQTEAAKALNIAQPSLSALESGASKTLGGETLARACRLFHTTADYIWFGAGASDDPEIPLVEAELIYMARSMTPERRQTALDSVRGIFKGQQPGGKNDPFAGHAPGDSDFGELTESGVKPYKGKQIQPFHPAAKKPGRGRKEG